jgi:flagellar transcriptional activator FlhD
MPDDLSSLNLTFLAIAREMARSRRDEAIIRLGLDQATCDVLGELSLADMQQLARSGALIFRLAQSPEQIKANLSLASRNPVLSEAHLLLSAGAGG